MQQVSAAGLPELLNKNFSEGDQLTSAAGASSDEAPLDVSQDMFSSLRCDSWHFCKSLGQVRNERLTCLCRTQAARTVAVPDAVQQLLVDLRSFLQEKCEPPVYVSDRRLLKAVNLLKVARGSLR